MSQPPPSRPPLGPMVARLRLAKGWSQSRLAAELCAAAGVSTLSRHEVSRWERQVRVPGRFWRGWLALVLAAPASPLATGPDALSIESGTPTDPAGRSTGPAARPTRPAATTVGTAARPAGRARRPRCHSPRPTNRRSTRRTSVGRSPADLPGREPTVLPADHAPSDQDA
ncbi:helix-turn-helix domain-containing protein [Verrucosispora sp. WMMD703]|uniref:helix-turn-helix domain-containing protein n=1 Tax=Verrucosispora sp. WMMD703 TaxID=3403463 RepID=UPI003B92FEF7